MPKASITAANAMISEAPSRMPKIGRNESERYSKKLSSQATLPLVLDRAAALTSASEDPAPIFCISGRAMISL